MIDLLNHTTIRRVKLLEYLFHSPARLSFKEISIEMNCSVKVVRGDLYFLSTNTSNKYFTLSIDNQSVLATFKDNVGPDKLAEFLFSESVALNIIEYIYNVEKTTLEDLADEFHISVSTVYRELKELSNNLSREFNLNIAYKPIRLTGNENDIRTFYLQYFSEKHSFFSWPFQDIDEDMLEEFLKCIFNFFGIPLRFVAFRNVKMTAAISFQRFKQGYKIADEKTILNEVFEELCSTFPPSLNFTSLFGQPLTPELMNELFYKYVVENFFFTHDDLLEATTKDKKVSQSYA